MTRRAMTGGARVLSACVVAYQWTLRPVIITNFFACNNGREN